MAVTEPPPPDTNWPRYSRLPFPSYRYVPGQTPHPRRHPEGHSYGQPDPKPTMPSTEHWQESDAYLHGIDLYNFAYWWESHELFEGVWHAAGRETTPGNFFQALIHLAAANLKHYLSNLTATRNLIHSGITRLQRLPASYMGVNVADLIVALENRQIDTHPPAPLISLDITR